ncbi:MAG: Hsp20/alpha crystallin family protein [Phycisphaerales bacterium]|nr:Hsp20/alpha crystallin family protein [Phycisphaerales bacterium]
MNLSLWRRRDPLNGGLSRFRDEIDRTFERFMSEPFGLIEAKSPRPEGWAPAIDVCETDAEVTIRAEAPGIPAKELDISVSGNTLTIAGQKEESSEKEEENFYHCERRFGSFRRSIDLPETVDADRISAESDNGVVTIHIAKKPGAKPKQIEVKAAAKKVAVAS